MKNKTNLSLLFFLSLFMSIAQNNASSDPLEVIPEILQLPEEDTHETAVDPNYPEIHDVYDLMQRDDMTLQEITERGDLFFDGKYKGRGSGYKQFQRFLYERQFHVDDDGYLVPPEVDQAEYEIARSTSENVSKMVGTWNEEGPFEFNTTSGWNAGHGRLTTFAIHPSQTRTIYVGSPGGGIWKTTDEGQNWIPLTDNNSNWMNIFSLAIDPSNRNNIYAGTRYGRFIKSTNGGDSWTEFSIPATGKIMKIVVNPNQGRIILAATANGIYKSYDYGETWVQRSSEYIEDIEYKPGTTLTMYATGKSAYKSTDYGNSWTKITASQGISDWNTRMLVSVTPANSNHVFILQIARDNKTMGKLYRSTNSGNSFSTRVTGNLTGKNYLGYEPNGVDDDGQGNYDLALAVSPTNANEVHLGGVITWKSNNAGSSFFATSEWRTQPNNLGYTHSDIHALDFINGNLYVASDGGISKSTNNAGDWRMLSEGLSIKQIYRLNSAPDNPRVWTAGAQDTGTTSKRADGTIRDWLGADGMDGGISPTDSNRMWGMTQRGGLNRTTDGGLTRRYQEGFGSAWVTPMVVHPTDQNIVFVGGKNGVFKSTDGGWNFNKISGNTISGNVVDLAISRKNANYIYATIGSKIYHSHNGGSNWFTYTSSNNQTISDIVVDPDSNNIVYYTTSNYGNSGRVFKLDVISTQQTNLSRNLPNIPARAIDITSDGNRLYIGMNVGVWRANTASGNYEDISSNLPRVAVRDIDIQRGSQWLRVATYGRGSWLYSFLAKSATLENQDDTASSDQLSLYPNPSEDVTYLHNIKTANIKSVILTTLEGRTIYRKDNLQVLDLNDLPLDTSQLSQGVYLIQSFNADGLVSTLKLSKK